MPLLWSAVTRDKIVLAECGEDQRGGAVLSLARKILSKKPTAGWEFERTGSLRAAKFHVHNNATAGREMVWAFSCVFDSDFSELQARGFLEKLAFLTEPLRETREWQGGGTLASQDSFAPTLLQRMEQASSMGRTAMITSKVDEVKMIMRDNIELLLDRGDKLEALDDKANTLSKMSQMFQKRARDARRFQMWQQAKFGLVLGTAVTVGVGLVVIPPLVAVL
uniref:V-SNARE coiled-coil homology domain-containing protein n=1 Tax=Coccolithus braarudii TaxID=221442 RepID=A0A7S0Q670_9EUKA|mmetsp:Transcript_39648/g.84448  ORF Transcript_39648/g.84448 Transcript_39648/m.84448 type:complete len:222 (+) Transcript_39648:176-841(+)|eukprot:CAMPEP_0183360556 /NCGR_PEP_ID=MMETSP0164_2-20130417/55570_1 /TAXON_ID=221442 /ORGANISM="Coccolithus pelagicus ssp braarudi, Strain PLY182g" /LENGTH=221 /DNA_ID=CAMNT_0025534953 /DNA_START=176 /DNA_END=841 /DNA_ORIENTATION=-